MDFSPRKLGARQRSGEGVVRRNGCRKGCFWRVRFCSAPLRSSGPRRCFWGQTLRGQRREETDSLPRKTPFWTTVSAHDAFAAPEITRNHPKPQISQKSGVAPKSPRNSHWIHTKRHTKPHWIPLNFLEISRISPRRTPRKWRVWETGSFTPRGKVYDFPPRGKSDLKPFFWPQEIRWRSNFKYQEDVNGEKLTVKKTNGGFLVPIFSQFGADFFHGLRRFFTVCKGHKR